MGGRERGWLAARGFGCWLLGVEGWVGLRVLDCSRSVPAAGCVGEVEASFRARGGEEGRERGGKGERVGM